MNEARSSDLKALRARLSELEICLSRSENGYFTVSSDIEPLFCFERSSIDEIQAVVTETITSYISTFYNVEGVNVTTVVQPLTPPEVVFQRVLQISRLIPKLSGGLNKAGVLEAC